MVNAVALQLFDEFCRDIELLLFLPLLPLTAAIVTIFVLSISLRALARQCVYGIFFNHSPLNNSNGKSYLYKFIFTTATHDIKNNTLASTLFWCIFERKPFVTDKRKKTEDNDMEKRTKRRKK